MAVRSIRIWPDPALKEKARPVATVDDGVRMLIDDLFETMYAANGIGLASTQVGVAQRILVIDLDPKKHAVHDPEVRAELDGWGFVAPVVLVNPVITASEGEIVWEEGCLSLPGITDDVKRKERITVEALDAQGQPLTLRASGLFAVAIQHELDHLNGKVFVEYLSRLKREGIKRKMLRLKADTEPAAAS